MNNPNTLINKFPENYLHLPKIRNLQKALHFCIGTTYLALKRWTITQKLKYLKNIFRLTKELKSLTFLIFFQSDILTYSLSHTKSPHILWKTDFLKRNNVLSLFERVNFLAKENIYYTFLKRLPIFYNCQKNIFTIKNIFTLAEKNYIFSLHKKVEAIHFKSVWILIWLGFWGIHLQVGGDQITPCLKLVRNILQTSDLPSKFTHICSCRKFSTKAFLFLLILALFRKKKPIFFWPK